MASNTETIKMLRAYQQTAKPTRYFTGMFRTTQESFHNSEKVEVDIERDDEDISIAVTDLSTGYRMNSADVYTNKEFTPPLHKESFPINSNDLNKRDPGVNKYADPVVQGKVILRAMKGFRKIENKIRRSIELQGAQILQTGVVTLTDISGNPIYELDFKGKASHFPVATVPWDDPGSDKYGDILALCNVIRDDGLVDVDELTFGENAFELGLKDDEFTKRFEHRRIEIANIGPMSRRGNGGIYRGTLEVGNVKVDVWTYSGRYKDPQTGNKLQYMDTNKVIAKVSDADLRATFGNVPLVVEPEQRLLKYLPSRFKSRRNRTDLHPNIWVSKDNTQLFGGLGSRPLLVPTAIDQFGCLDINV